MKKGDKRKISIYIDGADLISGDGDFAPLVRAIKILKKEIEIYTFKEVCSDALIKKNKFTFINKKLVNKCFFRERKHIEK